MNLRVRKTRPIERARREEDSVINTIINRRGVRADGIYFYARRRLIKYIIITFYHITLCYCKNILRT